MLEAESLHALLAGRFYSRASSPHRSHVDIERFASYMASRFQSELNV